MMAQLAGLWQPARRLGSRKVAQDLKGRGDDALLARVLLRFISSDARTAGK